MLDNIELWVYDAHIQLRPHLLSLLDQCVVLQGRKLKRATCYENRRKLELFFCTPWQKKQAVWPHERGTFDWYPPRLGVYGNEGGRKILPVRQMGRKEL